MLEGAPFTAHLYAPLEFAQVIGEVVGGNAFPGKVNALSRSVGDAQAASPSVASRASAAATANAAWRNVIWGELVACKRLVLCDGFISRASYSRLFIVSSFLNCNYIMYS